MKKQKSSIVAAPIRKRSENTLYVYVSPANRAHAMQAGRAKFGSASKYIDQLIAKDLGVRAPKTKTA